MIHLLQAGGKDEIVIEPGRYRQFGCTKRYQCHYHKTIKHK